MILRPATPKTTTVAVITLAGDTVSVYFPEIHDGFNTLAKRLGFRWRKPCWQRTISPRAGTAADRAAELGNRLLAAGFCVQLPGESIQQKAVAGDYAPEHTRWILRRTSGEYTDWFVFEWSRTDDLYKKVMRLTGARYRDGSVIVPSNHYEEVLDFADHFGFKLTGAAQALADEARARWQSALVVSVAKPKPAPLPNGPLTIPVRQEIADELADYD